METFTYNSIKCHVLKAGQIVDAAPQIYAGFGGAQLRISFTLNGVQYAGSLKGSEVRAAPVIGAV